MVVSSRRSRASRIVAIAAASLLAGCAVVPGSRLDDCHQVTRTLQSDNSRLKDSLLSLRSQFDDLAQRADDDARRLKVQDEEVHRLTASVHAYQDERETLARAFEELKGHVHLSDATFPPALRADFEAFAKAHPGCEFNPAGREAVLTLATDPLFAPGTARLTPEGNGLIRSLADLLTPRPGGLEGCHLVVAGHTDAPPVQRAGYSSSPSKGGHLGLDRAARVRDLLVLETRMVPDRIEAAGFESSRPLEEGSSDASRARNRRLEVRIRLEGASARIGSP